MSRKTYWTSWSPTVSFGDRALIEYELRAMYEEPRDPEDLLIEEELHTIVRDTFYKLSPDDQDLMIRRYGLDDLPPLTWKELGKKYPGTHGGTSNANAARRLGSIERGRRSKILAHYIEYKTSASQKFEGTTARVRELMYLWLVAVKENLPFPGILQDRSATYNSYTQEWDLWCWSPSRYKRISAHVKVTMSTPEIKELLFKLFKIGPEQVHDAVDWFLWWLTRGEQETPRR
jgi:hypothetical protein